MSEVYVLKKEEGGRHKAFFTGYRPQFYIRTMDVTGNINLPEGVEMVMPGDNVEPGSGTDRPGGAGAGLQIRHPRRRSDRRRGRDHQDFGLGRGNNGKTKDSHSP